MYTDAFSHTGEQVKLTSTDLKRAVSNIAFNFGFAVVALTIIGLFHKNIALTTVLLSLLSVIGFTKWKSTLTVVSFFVIAAFAIFIELFGVLFGVWSYTVPSSIGIPLWILVAWGIVASVTYQTTLELRRLGLKE